MIILSKDPKKMRGSAREELGKRTPGRRYSRCEIPKVVVGLAIIKITHKLVCTIMSPLYKTVEAERDSVICLRSPRQEMAETISEPRQSSS